MTTTTKVCVGASTHSPKYVETDRHHTFPKFLSSLIGVPIRTETVHLCAGCHDLVHHALRHLINSGTVDNHRLPYGCRIQVYAAWIWWQESLNA